MARRIGFGIAEFDLVAAEVQRRKSVLSVLIPSGAAKVQKAAISSLGPSGLN
jgi:hypothetical protein